MRDGCTSRDRGYISSCRIAETGWTWMLPGERSSLNRWPVTIPVWEYIPSPPRTHCLSCSPGDSNYCQAQTGCSLNHPKCNAANAVARPRKSEKIYIYKNAGFTCIGPKMSISVLRLTRLGCSSRSVFPPDHKTRARPLSDSDSVCFMCWRLN